MLIMQDSSDTPQTSSEHFSLTNYSVDHFFHPSVAYLIHCHEKQGFLENVIFKAHSSNQ